MNPIKSLYLFMISCFNMRKGMDVGQGFNFMIGALVLCILAFTWFFPTLNGENALNNTSTLIVGGTAYNWVIPLVVILVILGLVMYYFKASSL